MLFGGKLDGTRLTLSAVATLIRSRRSRHSTHLRVFEQQRLMIERQSQAVHIPII